MVTHLNMTLPSFDEITRSQRLSSFATMVAWSPLLTSKEERQEFEAFAAAQELQSQTESPDEASKACYICGSPDLGFPNPETTVALTGFAREFTCGDLDQAGRGGVILPLLPQHCGAVEEMIVGTCICGPREDENLVVKNDRSWAEGIFVSLQLIGYCSWAGRRKT